MYFLLDVVIKLNYVIVIQRPGYYLIIYFKMCMLDTVRLIKTFIFNNRVKIIN